tara:strand:- start:20 stop:592 length:573 start_codon:yes stop_codon:yes gene_type:complete
MRLVRYAALLAETLAVWCFFVYVEYAQACVALGVYAMFACCAEAQRARGNAGPVLDGAVFALWLTVHLTCALLWIPSRIDWTTTVLLAVFASMCAGTFYMKWSGGSIVFMEVYGRITATAALVNYANDISPPPDHRMDPAHYAWIKALAIFHIIGSALAFVLSMSLAAARVQDGKYGVLENYVPPDSPMA